MAVRRLSGPLVALALHRADASSGFALKALQGALMSVPLTDSTEENSTGNSSGCNTSNCTSRVSSNISNVTITADVESYNLTGANASDAFVMSDDPNGWPLGSVREPEQGPASSSSSEKKDDWLHPSSFDYHKPLFPLDWDHDGLTITLGAVSLVIAASGGIGGGSVLVPLFMLVLKLRPKHAIALSNFTIFGGAIANTLLNFRKRHPHHPERSVIDWDLILAMEPLTIFGAVFGSLISKVCPNIVLTLLLIAVLMLVGQRTFRKGVSMWQKESRDISRGELVQNIVEMSDVSVRTDWGERAYLEFASDGELTPAQGSPQRGVGFKIGTLTLCFAGTCILTVLKGGGHFESPFGVECGSMGYWLLYFSSAPWVLAFAAYFRCLLVSEFEAKVRRGYTFSTGEVQWNSKNTVTYPLLCAIAGLLAGLFGVGGGIVKGPLMLELGIAPAVASASAATMILFTSAAASTSFVVFGLLHPQYGLLFLVLGFVCTVFGQYSVGHWAKKSQRESPIVLSIGSIILLSSILVAVNAVAELAQPLGQGLQNLLRPHGVCGLDS